MNLTFTGTAYLGIPQHAEFREYLFEGIRKYGTHYGGSRLSNAAPGIYAEAERYLAAYTGAEAALIFSSGTLAGQILLKTISREAELHLAPGVHPALWEHNGPEHITYEQWAARMAALCTQEGPPIALLSNTVDPLGVRAYDFSFLSEIPIRRRVILVTDDSHGFWLLGPEGAGIYPAIGNLRNVEVLVMSSMGKAASIPAGLILGPKTWVDKIWNSPFFGGASPASPAFLHAFTHGEAIFRQQRDRLRGLLQYVTQRLPEEAPLGFFPDFPVFLIREKELAQRLAAEGISFSSFSYPTPQDPLVQRIVVNSNHTEAELDKVISQLSIEK